MVGLRKVLDGKLLPDDSRPVGNAFLHEPRPLRHLRENLHPLVSVSIAHLAEALEEHALGLLEPVRAPGNGPGDGKLDRVEPKVHNEEEALVSVLPQPRDLALLASRVVNHLLADLQKVRVHQLQHRAAAGHLDMIVQVALSSDHGLRGVCNVPAMLLPLEPAAREIAELSFGRLRRELAKPRAHNNHAFGSSACWAGFHLVFGRLRVERSSSAWRRAQRGGRALRSEEGADVGACKDVGAPRSEVGEAKLPGSGAG
mmetsp:Transcript_47972/g.111234  ORF Transcript_47972/g.111234 Transcript_47972/m.111234 type:complete len:257 (-) Transcript_47972:302-1072(-)